MCRVDHPPRRRATAGIGAGRPSARTPSPGCSADARASSSVSVTPGPTELTSTYGVTYLKIVVETPLFVVLRLVLKRPLGMLPWST